MRFTPNDIFIITCVVLAVILSVTFSFLIYNYLTKHHTEKDMTKTLNSKGQIPKIKW